MTKAKNVDLIIHAGAIATINIHNQILTNHSIIIQNSHILDIIPTECCNDRYSSTNTFDLPEHVLMPGLINAHGHAAMSLMRGLADDYALMDWLNDYIWPIEQKFVSAEFVLDGTELAIAEMLRSGTTCFSDMYFYPEVAAKCAEDIGIRAQFTSPIFDFPSNWGSGPDDYLNKGKALIEEYKHSNLINICFGPHAPYTVSDAPMLQVKALATELNVGVHIHLHETQFEVDTAIEETGLRPIQRLQKLGLFNPSLQTVHMTSLTPEDIDIVASSGASVIHCPESNLKLASGMTPIQQCIDAGINVALGTDGAASNNGLNMFSEMRTAAMLAKTVANDPTAVNAEQALRLATINGAKALGIDHITGSLEIGKAADIIAIDFSALEMQPLYHITSQLVYTHPSQNVTHSWVAGKTLMADKKLLSINESDVIKRAKQWQLKLQSSAPADK